MAHLSVGRRLSGLVIGGVLVLCGAAYTQQSSAAPNTYGSGLYGACQYNSCGISLTSSGNVSLDIVPTSGTKCTVSSDTVSVTTDSSTGYTLTLIDGDANNQLVGTTYGQHISPSSGSASSPVALVANSWGYRVDGADGFGSGPTSTQSSSSVPSLAFAAVPASSSGADTIINSISSADPAVGTTVWYGACVNAALPSDTYTDSVTYTALVN